MSASILSNLPRIHCLLIYREKQDAKRKAFVFGDEEEEEEDLPPEPAREKRVNFYPLHDLTTTK